MNFKELNKLAKACRKAGITHYKCSEFEITVNPEVPAKLSTKNSSPSKIDLSPDKFATEGELSDMDMLLWSSTGGVPIEGLS